MEIKKYKEILQQGQEYYFETHQIDGNFRPEDAYLQQYLTDTIVFESEGSELDFVNSQIESTFKNLQENLREIEQEIKPIIDDVGVISADDVLRFLKYDIGEGHKYLSFLLTKKRSLQPLYDRINIDSINNSETVKAITPATTLEPLNTLVWKGTSLQFAEITKALIESGLIGAGLSDKEVFERMKLFFSVGDFDKSEKLAQVRKRTKDLTPTLNILEDSLSKWIKRDEIG